MNSLDITEQRIVKDPTKRHAWIKYKVQILGLSMAGVAAAAVPPMDRRNFYQVFTKPFPRAEKIIADCLKYKAQDLFPDRYTEDGIPNRNLGRRPNPKDGNTYVKTLENSTNKKRRNVYQAGAI